MNDQSLLQRVAGMVLPLAVGWAFLWGDWQSCRGQNLGFMPGDSFYKFSLTEHFVNDLPKQGETITFDYIVSLQNFGGYAGFNKLRLAGATPSLSENLQLVYRHHRKFTPMEVRIEIAEDGTRNDIEVNPPLALIYNRDVDWTTQRIALKYNEDWPNLPAEAFDGPGRNLDGEKVFSRAEVYQPLIKTYRAVVEDWQNAKRFAPLKVEVPTKVAWGKAHHPIAEPVLANSNDVQIIVLQEANLNVYFRQQSGVEFYRITNEGAEKCRWKKSNAGITLETSKLDSEDDRNRSDILSNESPPSP